VGGERVDEVGVQAAALQATGGVGRQEPFDAALAGLGLAAERQLAVDHRAAQRAFGVVVGRLDAAMVGERPQRRPDLEQVARQAPGVLVALALAEVAAQDRLELAAQRPNPQLQAAAVAGVLVSPRR
jgi:hypothetical protein